LVAFKVLTLLRLFTREFERDAAKIVEQNEICCLCFCVIGFIAIETKRIKLLKASQENG